MTAEVVSPNNQDFTIVLHGRYLEIHTYSKH